MKEYEKPYLRVTVWNANDIFCNGSMEDLQSGGTVGDEDDFYGG